MAKCTECGHDHSDWVTKSHMNEEIKTRTSKVSGQRTEARNKAESLEASISDLQERLDTQTKLAESSNLLIDRLAEFKVKEQGWGQERAIMGAGITDAEGIQFASMAYAQLAEDKRPEGGVADWLKNTEALPRGVAAYLPTDTPAPAAGAPTPTAGAPKANAGVVPTPGAPGQFTPRAINAMDNAAYAANRAAIFADLGLGTPKPINGAKAPQE